MLTVFKNANLVLAFILELTVLFSVGTWGFSLKTGLAVRLLVGLGGPAVLIALWTFFGAPGATMYLHGGARLAFEIVWFGVGAAALAATGGVIPPIVFVVLFVVNHVLIRVWHQSGS